MILAQKLESEVKTIFSKYYGLRSDRTVKELFTRFIIQAEINTKSAVLKIGKIIQMLMVSSKRLTINKNDFLMALILYHLSDSKLKKDQIERHLAILTTDIDIDNLLLELKNQEYIEFEDNYYKLKVLSLFRG